MEKNCKKYKNLKPTLIIIIIILFITFTHTTPLNFQIIKYIIKLLNIIIVFFRNKITINSNKIKPLIIISFFSLFNTNQNSNLSLYIKKIKKAKNLLNRHNTILEITAKKLSYKKYLTSSLVFHWIQIEELKISNPNILNNPSITNVHIHNNLTSQYCWENTPLTAQNCQIINPPMPKNIYSLLEESTSDSVNSLISI